MPQRSLKFDFLVLTGLALIWGSSFMVIRVIVEEIPPLTLTAARVTLAAILLFTVLMFKKESLPKSLTLWGWCFCIGIFGTAFPFFMISWGEQRVESSTATILMSVMPLATLILAHFFSPDKMNIQKFIGILVGFSGVIVLVGPETLQGLGGDVIYQIAIMSAALSYAIANVVARNFPASPLLSRTAAVMICAALQMLPLSIFMDQPWTLTPGTISLVGVLYLGIFPTALASLIFFYLIAARGPSFVAYVNYMIPLAGVGWGTMLLGEELTQTVIIALLIILSGIAIATFKRKS